MTDATDRLDGVKARLQAEPVKRSKKPRYLVFRLAEVDAEPHTFVCLGEFDAPSRREAIKVATAKGEEASKSGTFLICPAGQAQTIKRTIKQTTLDEFE